MRIGWTKRKLVAVDVLFEVVVVEVVAVVEVIGVVEVVEAAFVF